MRDNAHALYAQQRRAAVLGIVEPAPERWVRKGRAAEKAMGHTAPIWTRPTPVAPRESIDAAAHLLGAGKQVASDTSLLARFPLVAAEWHPTLNGVLTPAGVTWGSKQKVSWLCAAGHTWEAVVNSRTRKIGATKIKVCSGIARISF